MGIIASGILIGVVPFALSDTVNGAIVAGIFSVVNTMLNLRLIRYAKRTNENISGARSDARVGANALLDMANGKDKDEKASE